MSDVGSLDGARDTDLAVRVVVPKLVSEMAGAVLMDRMGPYAEEPDTGDTVALVFYPQALDVPCDAELVSLLPEDLRAEGKARVERQAVPRDWVHGWRAHFHPLVIGDVRVRPPWEPAQTDGSLADVVINPGLAFGTGLHPTTGGALTLLQQGGSAAQAQQPGGSRGTLVDAGTGSGILSIAAAKLGWGPIVALDDDGVALVSARENIVENGVAGVVQVHECDVTECPLGWFAGATVLANMTLEPLLVLVPRLAAARPRRVVVAGLLAGAQEEEFVRAAQGCGFSIGRRLYETEWVSMELFPLEAIAAATPAAGV
jgi:ribosomal protein L11 methyltransferase